MNLPWIVWFIFRLRGSRDINRLSDKILLYIFSLLLPQDVNISAQVALLNIKEKLYILFWYKISNFNNEILVLQFIHRRNWYFLYVKIMLFPQINIMLSITIQCTLVYVYFVLLRRCVDDGDSCVLLIVCGWSNAMN